MKYIWLIPLLPGIGAAINGLIGIRFFSRRMAGVVACAMMTAALGISLLAFWQLLQLAPDARAYDYVVGNGFRASRWRRAARSDSSRSTGDSASIRCRA